MYGNIEVYKNNPKHKNEIILVIGGTETQKYQNIFENFNTILEY